MNKEQKLYQKLYDARRERECAKRDLKKLIKNIHIITLELNEIKFQLKERDEEINKIKARALDSFIINHEIFAAFGLPIKGDRDENLKIIMQKIKLYNFEMNRIKKTKTKNRKITP
jgi:hypothetical protein